MRREHRCCIRFKMSMQSHRIVGLMVCTPRATALCDCTGVQGPSAGRGGDAIVMCRHHFLWWLAGVPAQNLCSSNHLNKLLQRRFFVPPLFNCLRTQGSRLGLVPNMPMLRFIFISLDEHIYSTTVFISKQLTVIPINSGSSAAACDLLPALVL